MHEIKHDGYRLIVRMRASRLIERGLEVALSRALVQALNGSAERRALRVPMEIDMFAAKLRMAASEIANKARGDAETQAQLDAANLAYERLAQFEPEIGGALQCPGCWIDYGSHAPLVAVPGVSPGAPNVFQCSGCGFDLKP